MLQQMKDFLSIHVENLNQANLFGSFRKTCLLVLIGLFGFLNGHSQFTSTWALTANGTPAVTGAQSANINSGTMTPLVTTGTGTFGTNGYGIQTTRANWPTAPSDLYYLDFPLSPQSGYDINFTTLTFNSRTSGGSGNSGVTLSYQMDGTGPWTAITATPAFPHLFSGSSSNYSGSLAGLTFNGGHTYVIRMYVYWPSSSSSAGTNRTNTIGQVVFNGNTVVSGPPPSVVTTGSGSVTRNSAVASGSVTPVQSAVTESGICYGTAINPTTANSVVMTSPVVSSGPFSVNLTGLSANTIYHFRAYAVNGVGTSYGEDMTFQTSPAVQPTVTTAAISAITPVSAKSGGNVSDDGGATVSARGVCWNTTGTPTIANNNTSNGTGLGSFTSNLTSLNPSTTYFVRAYATNTAGTAYGNEVSFTTLAPTPTLIVDPATLTFGTILQGSTAPVQSYTITGYFLTPAAGNISIVAPPGYKVSTNASSGFASTLQLPYTGSALATTVIYVSYSPTALANYNKDIVNSGGGAPSQNVAVQGDVEPSGANAQPGFSNKGKDFWVGFSPTEKMGGSDTTLYNLRFTFNNPNPVAATVVISIPNLPAFNQLTYSVPANSVVTTNAGDLPTGVSDPNLDSRITTEGVLKAGIHIVSDQPIVAYAHNVTSQVYAATVLFPTPTLGREYTSLNFTQRSNSSASVSRSFCFAIATEDNTLIEVTLPQSVSTDTHAAGSTFTQLLNKGEILNLFGEGAGSRTSIDLTGVVFKSISGTSGCKPFAFFCGSGKIGIDCLTSNPNSSSDNLFQQMFPKVAWGYKYITAPTQPANMNNNHFRILIQDPATVVKRNGVTLTGLVNNTYYEYFNDQKTVDIIEADKPIMVAQYMTTNGKCGNATGSGDPEMIYLSSVQQTIDSVSLVSSPMGNTTGRQHFLNIFTKTNATSQFKLDGNPVQFAPVPYDNSYSYAQVSVAESSHTLTSPVGFNAIAYGVANDESYGYNAGTNLIDLFSGFSIQNQFSSGTSIAACRGSEFYMRITLAFRATSISWDFNNNSNLTPNAAVVQNNPVPEDSVVVNGVKLYIYKLPNPYIYNTIGTFFVKISANNPTPDGCNGIRNFNFPINVNAGPSADFTFSGTNGCLAPVQFTNASSGNGGTIDTWQWNFGDTPPGTSTQQNPSYTYASGGTYQVKLRVITAEGCYGDVTKPLTFSGIPAASYTGPTTGCVNQPVTFNNSSTVASGTITQWNWNFGDGSAPVNATNGNPQTHTYTGPGNFNVSLTVVTSTGCTSTAFIREITINPLPTVSFGTQAGVCNTTPSFTLTGGTPATVAGVGTGVYSGPGVTAGVFNPATAGVATHTLTYTYTTQAGCVGSATQTIAVAQAATLSINAVQPLCVNGDAVTLTPNVAGGVFAGNGITGSSFNPATAGVGTHTISYSIPSNACTIPASLQIVVNPAPTDVNAGTNQRVIFGNSVILNGSSSTATLFQWTPPDRLSSPSVLTPLASPLQSTTYTLQGTNSFGCSAKDDVFVEVIRPCVDPAKAFTPNGDGYNDLWNVYNGDCVVRITVDVYNRWGGMVFHSDNYSNNWDGTYKHNPLPDATYYYILKADLIGGYQTRMKGNVTIIR